MIVPTLGACSALRVGALLLVLYRTNFCILVVRFLIISSWEQAF